MNKEIFIEVFDRLKRHIGNDQGRLAEAFNNCLLQVEGWLAVPTEGTANACKLAASENMTDRILVNAAFSERDNPKKWTYGGAHIASAAWYFQQGKDDQAYSCLRASIRNISGYLLQAEDRQAISELESRCHA